MTGGGRNYPSSLRQHDSKAVHLPTAPHVLSRTEPEVPAETTAHGHPLSCAGPLPPASLPQLPSVFPGTSSLYNCPDAALRTCAWGDWMKIRDQPLLSCRRFLPAGKAGPVLQGLPIFSRKPESRVSCETLCIFIASSN